MKSSPRFLLISLTALCLCSCSKPNPSEASPPAIKTEAPAEAAPAAADDKAGTFWELPDKSDLRVVTAPWPPKAGTAILKAEVTANDESEKFAGVVSYRVTTTEKSSAAWKALPKVREDGDKSVYFEAPVTLSNGIAFIQFRVQGAGDSMAGKNVVDLIDWKLEIK